MLIGCARLHIQHRLFTAVVPFARSSEPNIHPIITLATPAPTIKVLRAFPRPVVQHGGDMVPVLINDPCMIWPRKGHETRGHPHGVRASVLRPDLLTALGDWGEINASLSPVAREGPRTDRHLSDLYFVARQRPQRVTVAHNLLDPVHDEGDRVDGDSGGNRSFSIGRRASGRRPDGRQVRRRCRCRWFGGLWCVGRPRCRGCAAPAATGNEREDTQSDEDADSVFHLVSLPGPPDGCELRRRGQGQSASEASAAVSSSERLHGTSPGRGLRAIPVGGTKLSSEAPSPHLGGVLGQKPTLTTAVRCMVRPRDGGFERVQTDGSQPRDGSFERIQADGSQPRTWAAPHLTRPADPRSRPASRRPSAPHPCRDG